MGAKLIKKAIFALCMLLSPMDASAECTPGAAEAVALFDTWRTHMEDALDHDPRAAMQDLKTEADRVGRAMEGVSGLNHFNARHWDLFEHLAGDGGPEASTVMSERLAYQVAWASRSLGSLSACLTHVPVDVVTINDISLGGAAILMRYVRPELFVSIGVLEQALRTEDPVNLEEARAIWSSLRAVNNFVDISGGSFSECENSMRDALVRGATIVIMQEHFTEAAEPAIVSLDASAAAMTLAEADRICGRP